MSAEGKLGFGEGDPEKDDEGYFPCPKGAEWYPQLSNDCIVAEVLRMDVLKVRKKVPSRLYSESLAKWKAEKKAEPAIRDHMKRRAEMEAEESKWH